LAHQKIVRPEIKFNYQQLSNIKGGIGRDSQTFLKELENRYSFVANKESVVPVSLSRINFQLKNFASLLGISLPVDIFHEINFAEIQLSRYKLVRKSSVHIIRLHDLFPITHPEWFRFRTRVLFKRSIERATSRKNTIFYCNSKYTKDSLLRMFPNSDFQTYILPCSFNLTNINKCGKCQGCLLTKKDLERFVLMVGTVEPRKNYQMLMESRSKISGNIFIVGRYGWKQRNLKKVLLNLQPSENVKWIKNCCDASLINLYMHAKVFLSTSIEEGFNIPALEAQHFGCKLLLSSNSVHKELYSERAFFFKDSTIMCAYLNSALNGNLWVNPKNF
jgi:glycosyltransferase involved in cell wall biosynthesis